MGLFDKFKNAFKKKEIVSEPTELEAYDKGLEKTRQEFVSELSILGHKYTKVSEEYFEELGQNSLCQSIQKKNLETYWRRAIDPICKNYNLKTCRGYVMAFDIAVKDWALGDTAYNQIQSQITESTTERDILNLMAQYGSASSRARHEAIARGTGTVNEEPINLDADYGLNDTPFR